LSLPPLARKLLLLAHLTTSVGFVGAVAAFLVLAISGLNGRPVYADLQLGAWWVALPAAWLSLILGLVSALGTPWGLVRHWWVIAKLVLTVVAVAVLQLQMRTIDALAKAQADGTLASLAAGKSAMVLHASGGLAVLLLLALLSVYKPRGVTRFAPRIA
jgi:hypothetical protein